jgi:hypothetical protein
MRYLTAQYLPYTPLRSLLDITKNELTTKISKKMIDQCELSPLKSDQLDQFKEFPKAQIVDLCKTAYKTVTPRIEKLKILALSTIQTDITEELNRTTKLKVLDIEKERLTQQIHKRHDLLKQAITNAKPQLDSIRVIFPKN